MPDILDETGLTLKRLSEIKEELENAFREIYGEDINLDQNTPDGQMIGIESQAMIDIRELIQEVYNSFDPDKAIGVSLDARVAINGLQRRGGTYTYVPIKITTNRALNLVGLDSVSEDEAYTISDSQGNLFVLGNSVSFESAQDKTAIFRAKSIGAVEILPNTINTPITIILGVESINNPSVASVKGIEQEADAELRLRRQSAFGKSSLGYPMSVRSALLDINDVSYVKVYENTTSITDANQIQAHGIWIIVEGGNNQEIAEAIYAKRSGGTPMKGSVVVNVPQIDGQIFVCKFDRPILQNLYINLSVKAVSGELDLTYIKNQIVIQLKPDIYQTIDKTMIEVLVKEIQANAVVLNCGLSVDNSNWEAIVSPNLKNAKFLLSVENITITQVLTNG
ncbi:MAG: hypothetical protein LBT79_07975 [Elusimicrobiota bacterium]|jgi:uncharacterized phage protein gp47/JayE|nr:hypothetical protein [Elusimicrobiota bacterium]